MVSSPALEDALPLALKLAPQERLRLVERVVASVERELAAASPPDADTHWGENLNRLLDELNLSEWDSVDMDDPVAWIKAQREHDERRHDDYWDGNK
jgi:hypothetical protein